jgi:hypothetical protein
MMKMFKRPPDLAAQVEDLDIELKSDSLFNSRRLLNIFPNARVMRVTHGSGLHSSKSKVHNNTEHIVTTHLTSRIESLSDIHPCNLMSQIIYSDLGGRLDDLYLNFKCVSRSSIIVSQLKGLPVLKTITLDTPTISIHNLEELHNNISSIENYRLNNMTVEPGNMPVYIVPTTGIKKLKFYSSYVVDSRDHTRIYQYTTQKYNNIADIEYDDLTLHEEYTGNKNELYLHGLPDFYKLIGPCTSDFIIRCLPDGIDIFEALDAVSFQVKKLEFCHCQGGTTFQDLSQSNQYNHAEELRFWDTGLDSIYLIKNMTNLTTLEFVRYEDDFPPIQLVDCLDVCPPSLKSFKVSCNKLVVKPFKNNLDSIETLDISCVALGSVIGDFISSCFPNLVELRLAFKMGQNINITLKNPHFRKAEFFIDVYCDSDDFGFSIEPRKLLLLL